MNDSLIAKWVVEISNKLDIRHEEVNMGIWFFCANIVQSKYKLKNLLYDFRESKSVTNNYRKRIKNLCMSIK